LCIKGKQAASAEGFTDDGSAAIALPTLCPGATAKVPS